MHKLWRFVLLLLPLQTHAWGILGHQVIGEIARRHVTAAALSATQARLGSDTWYTASTWADKVKYTPAFAQTGMYHFTDTPDHTDYLTYLKVNPGANGDVVLGFLEAEAMLANPASSPDIQSHALKFLFHFIGDMHQPLHSGRETDQGGHLIPVTWYGQNTNLHVMWDSLIIYAAHPHDLSIIIERPTLNIDNTAMIQRYANYLEAKYGPATNVTNCAPPDPIAWVNESTEARDVSYAGYYDDNDAYLARATPVLEQRLYAAGLRLGCTLNAIFVPRSPPPPTTWGKIKAALGIATPTDPTMAILNPNADLKNEVEGILGISLESIVDLTQH